MAHPYEFEHMNIENECCVRMRCDRLLWRSMIDAQEWPGVASVAQCSSWCQESWEWCRTRVLCATVGNSVKRRNSKKSDVGEFGVSYYSKSTRCYSEPSSRWDRVIDLGAAVDSVRTVTKGVTHVEVHMRQSRRGVWGSWYVVRSGRQCKVARGTIFVVSGKLSSCGRAEEFMKLCCCCQRTQVNTFIVTRDVVWACEVLCGTLSAWCYDIVVYMMQWCICKVQCRLVYEVQCRCDEYV